MNNTVLIVAAHSDDEVLGCGGAIARHVDEDDLVHVIFISDGVSSRDDFASDDLSERIECAKNAHRILGIESAKFLSFPDNKLDNVPLVELVRPLESHIRSISPNIVYTHHYGDLNVDHRIAHQSALIACRPAPGCSVKEIYTFEIVSSTDWASPVSSPFLPSHFVDISDYLAIKLEALKAYELEMRPEPHSRSFSHVEALAKCRGQSIGVEAAEGFMTIRSIR